MSWTSGVDSRLGSLGLRLVYQKDLSLSYRHIKDNSHYEPDMYTPGYTTNQLVLLSWRAEARRESPRFIRVETVGPLAEAYEDFIYQHCTEALLPYVVKFGSERTLILYSRAQERASPFPFRKHPELERFVISTESIPYVASEEIHQKVAEWINASIHSYSLRCSDEDLESFGMEFGLWGPWYNDVQRILIRR